jgi:hypothetical protein
MKRMVVDGTTSTSPVSRRVGQNDTNKMALGRLPNNQDDRDSGFKSEFPSGRGTYTDLEETVKQVDNAIGR